MSLNDLIDQLTEIRNGLGNLEVTTANVKNIMDEDFYDVFNVLIMRTIGDDFAVVLLVQQ